MEWTEFVTCCDACQKRKKKLGKVAKKSDDAMCQQKQFKLLERDVE